MSDITEKAIQKSTDYYNSSDTDTYYRKIWGGESIHVGIFDKPGISIREAARQAVTYLANRLDSIGSGKTVIDPPTRDRLRLQGDRTQRKRTRVGGDGKVQRGKRPGR